jgi:hypothetical protein
MEEGPGSTVFSKCEAFGMPLMAEFLKYTPLKYV